ncbi:MAG: fe II 2-oxoglutarate-dependent dioxygenase [Lasallia pustulata]|uniref:Fe II 2-oxoglutarate-dependent dioxygenase n=1 Tax=Lasallia pustulata TaxID=136370 RepID=A0A5M8Q296_9LECA|nr:MAG: fe II 2-oxoglutarate-dependent dioxygenase [Lasallia pustulata]
MVLPKRKSPNKTWSSTTTPQSPLHPSKPSDDEPSSTAEEEKGKSHDARAPAAPVSKKPLPATTKPPAPSTSGNPAPTTDVGGYEVYMAGDDDPDTVSDAGVPVPPPSAQNPYPTPSSSFPPPSSSSFSHPNSKSNPDPKSNPIPNPNPTTTKSSDPAVYHSATAGEDDGVLFSVAAGWNVMSVVLRDRGVLRFVKFVRRRAGGEVGCGRVVGVGDDGGEGMRGGGGRGREGWGSGERRGGEGGGKWGEEGKREGWVGLGESETESEELGSEEDDSSD